MQNNLKHYELIIILIIIILSLSMIVLITEPNIVGLVTTTSVTILNVPPYPVQLISPEDEEIINTTEILLEWNPTTDPNGEPVISYWLRTSNQSDYNNTIINDSNATGTNYTLNASALNLSNTNYYWQVLAYDGDNYSTNNTRRFRYCNLNQGPNISEVADQTMYVNDRFVLQLNASDPDNDSINFLITNPLRISEDGLINITVNTTGEFTIIVFVEDSCEEIDSISFTLTVEETPETPSGGGGGGRITQPISEPREENITNVTIEEVEERIIKEMNYVGNLDIQAEILVVVEEGVENIFTYDKVNYTFTLVQVFNPHPDRYFLNLLTEEEALFNKKGIAKEFDITEDGEPDIVFKLENTRPLIVSIKRIEKKKEAVIEEVKPVKTGINYWLLLLEGVIILTLVTAVLVERNILKKKFAIAKSGNCFILRGGEKIKSIKELLEVMRYMNNEIYFSHVNHKNNDFANWIRYVFHNKKLAERIEKAKTRFETIKILEDFFK
ncbi:hypothetical protein HQ533_02040 [Candidatus Woesearchaeota archaeon]|nr:hypothetical protein [Candidatus Woesearchaeota archaeon]